MNVSSFSVVIRFPNHERFVSSGDESGVKYTSSEDTVKLNGLCIVMDSEMDITDYDLVVFTLQFSSMESWAA